MVSRCAYLFMGKRMGLSKESASLPELQRLTEALRAAHHRLWMAACKPFGWEVLDIPVTINSPLYHRIVTASCFSE